MKFFHKIRKAFPFIFGFGFGFSMFEIPGLAVLFLIGAIGSIHYNVKKDK